MLCEAQRHGGEGQSQPLPPRPQPSEVQASSRRLAWPVVSPPAGPLGPSSRARSFGKLCHTIPSQASEKLDSHPPKAWLRVPNSYCLHGSLHFVWIFRSLPVRVNTKGMFSSCVSRELDAGPSLDT